MSLTYLIVVDVVRWSDLERACPKFLIDVVIRDDGDGTLRQGHVYLLTHEMGVALVFRVHGYRGVAHDGLRTYSSDSQVFLRALHLVTDMVQRPILVAVDDLFVGKDGLRLWIPVGHAQPTIKLAFFVQVHEHLRDGLAKARIHRKACAVPIAGGPQALELFENDPAILFFPGPGMRQKLFAGEVSFFDALLTQALHDFGLSCDGGVVHTGHPARVFA